MLKIYFFIKRNRIRKKWLSLKQLISLTIDFTTLFYGLIILGYFIFALIAEGFSLDFIYSFTEIELLARNNIWYIITIIPIAKLMQAFQSPGVLISSAEYQLTILPYSRMKVWLTAAVERWLKDFFIYILLGTLVYIFTPISLTTIALYILILQFLSIVLTTVEWRFFQEPVHVKIFILIGLMIINVLAIIISSPTFAIAFLFLLVIWNILLFNKLFHEIDWQKVTAANDYKLWRMLIISYATKIKYQKDRKYSVWQRLPFWRKPFHYKKDALYHRLWHLYLEKNVSYILQLIGALLVMLIVFSFMREWLFLLAVVVTIHIYTTFAVTLFKDRLSSDIVQVLPWDLKVFKRTFERWILVSSTVLFIPLLTKAISNFTLWTLLQWVLIIFTFYILLHIKLYRVFLEFDKNDIQQDIFYFIGYGLLVIIFLSYKFPIVLFIGLGIIVFTAYYFKRKIAPRFN